MSQATFTRMDESTAEEWAEIGRQVSQHQPRVAESVLAMLRSIGSIVDGFSTDQLTHCLQTATMAEQAGADDEVVVAALCHDIGKAVSVPNHGAIAAEILKPYVRPDVYHMIRVHQDFQGKYYYQHFDLPQDLRDKYRDEPWFALTAQFTDEWDQAAFDPNGETYPLEHFEDRVRTVFAAPRY
ncbi:MAG: HD domain-containing protein [Actinobacteria bacterium]|nr:HD domain-containing protein [Actinomycetota bacterium]